MCMPTASLQARSVSSWAKSRAGRLVDAQVLPANSTMVKGAYQKLETPSDPEVALESTAKRGYVKATLVSVGVALLVAATVGGAMLMKHHRHHHKRHHRQPEKLGAGFLF